MIFHRLVPGFVIQGGDGKFGKASALNADRVGSGGPAYRIKDEPVTARYGRGTVAMARTNDPHSATAQFFINIADNDFLDFKSPSGSGWGYCVFGKVSGGMDVVDKIRAVRTVTRGFHQDVPAEDVLITSAEIV